MMNSMRKNMKVILWVVVAAFVGTIFFVWGMDAGNQKNYQEQTSAAVVNGIPISYETFGRLYDQRYKSLFEGQKQDPTEQDIERLKGDLIDALIDSTLLRQEAERLGLTVFPEEVAARIASIPAFQQEGKFSPEHYLQVLAYSRISPDHFEAEQAESLLMLKMDRWLKDSLVVTPEEVKDYFSMRARKLRIQLVQFNWKDQLKNVSVTDEQVQAYYHEHRREFDQPLEVKASHILISVNKDTPEEEKLTAKLKLENIKAEIQKGADFAKVAQENSDDPGSKENGGDLGYFRKGMMVPEFEKAAFSLRPGELSDIVETQFGYHLIKVTGRREEKTSTLAGVKKEIHQRLTEEAARQRQQQDALAFMRLMQAPGGLSAAAKTAKAALQTTGWIDEKSSLSGIPDSQPVLNRVFDLAVGKPAGPIQAGESLVFAEIAEEKFQPFVESIFQLEYDSLLEKLKQARGERLRIDWLAQARRDAKIVDNIRKTPSRDAAVPTDPLATQAPIQP